MVAVLYWLLCCFNVYQLYVFFHSTFERNLRKAHFIGSGLLTILIIIYIYSFKNTNLNMAVVPLVYLSFVLATFKISIYNAITYTIIFFVVFVVEKAAAFSLLNRLLYDVFPQQYMDFGGAGGIYVVIVGHLLGYLILLLTINKTKMLNITREKHFSKYLIVIPAASLSILYGLIYMDFPEETPVQLLICIGAFLLYFSNIVMFFILSKYVHVADQIKSTQMYALKMELEAQNHKKVEEINRKNQCFVHDSYAFYNNIRILALRNENRKIVKIINQLHGQIHKVGVEKNYSSNAILDAIISECVIRCEAQNIKIDMFIEPALDIDFVQESDLISMFGNLMDNGIEAAAKCNNGQRKMTVKLFMANKYIIVFRIANSFIDQRQKDSGVYLTTKKDKQSHGLGLGIAKALVEKYGGDLELTEEKGNFITTVTLSNAFSDLEPDG